MERDNWLNYNPYLQNYNPQQNNQYPNQQYINPIYYQQYNNQEQYNEQNYNSQQEYMYQMEEHKNQKKKQSQYHKLEKTLLQFIGKYEEIILMYNNFLNNINENLFDEIKNKLFQIYIDSIISICKKNYIYDEKCFLYIKKCFNLIENNTDYLIENNIDFINKIYISKKLYNKKINNKKLKGYINFQGIFVHFITTLVYIIFQENELIKKNFCNTLNNYSLKNELYIYDYIKIFLLSFNKEEIDLLKYVNNNNVNIINFFNVYLLYDLIFFKEENQSNENIHEINKLLFKLNQNYQPLNNNLIINNKNNNEILFDKIYSIYKKTNIYYFYTNFYKNICYFQKKNQINQYNIINHILKYQQNTLKNKDNECNFHSILEILKEKHEEKNNKTKEFVETLQLQIDNSINFYNNINKQNFSIDYEKILPYFLYKLFFLLSQNEFILIKEEFLKNLFDFNIKYIYEYIQIFLLSCKKMNLKIQNESIICFFNTYLLNDLIYFENNILSAKNIINIHNIFLYHNLHKEILDYPNKEILNHMPYEDEDLSKFSIYKYIYNLLLNKKLGNNILNLFENFKYLELNKIIINFLITDNNFKIYNEIFLPYRTTSLQFNEIINNISNNIFKNINDKLFIILNEILIENNKYEEFKNKLREIYGKENFDKSDNLIKNICINQFKGYKDMISNFPLDKLEKKIKKFEEIENKFNLDLYLLKFNEYLDKNFFINIEKNNLQIVFDNQVDFFSFHNVIQEFLSNYENNINNIIIEDLNELLLNIEVPINIHKNFSNIEIFNNFSKDSIDTYNKYNDLQVKNNKMENLFMNFQYFLTNILHFSKPLNKKIFLINISQPLIYIHEYINILLNIINNKNQENSFKNLNDFSLNTLYGLLYFVVLDKKFINEILNSKEKNIICNNLIKTLIQLVIEENNILNKLLIQNDEFKKLNIKSHNEIRLEIANEIINNNIINDELLIKYLKNENNLKIFKFILSKITDDELKFYFINVIIFYGSLLKKHDLTTIIIYKINNIQNSKQIKDKQHIGYYLKKHKNQCFIIKTLFKTYPHLFEDLINETVKIYGPNYFNENKSLKIIEENKIKDPKIKQEICFIKEQQTYIIKKQKEDKKFQEIFNIEFEIGENIEDLYFDNNTKDKQIKNWKKEFQKFQNKFQNK